MSAADSLPCARWIESLSSPANVSWNPAHTRNSKPLQTSFTNASSPCNSASEVEKMPQSRYQMPPMSKRAITHLSSDPVMSILIEKVGPIRLRPRRLSAFQSLKQAIIHQQLSGNAAGTILGRFKMLFPDDEFPTPSRVAMTSVERLRTAGLSRPKAAYIIDLAKRCNAGPRSVFRWYRALAARPAWDGNRAVQKTAKLICPI
jgi:3-methyladenine DNA glycosylase/8-oxoguanine DNA glycosylase